MTEYCRFVSGLGNNFIVSGRNGYDHKKRFTHITADETPPKRKRLIPDKSNNDEGRQITDEYYENDLRHKPASMGLYDTSEGEGFNQPLFQLIDCYDITGMQNLNRQPAIMNGERVAIVAQIIRLIINCFEAKPYGQKIRK